MNLGFYPRLRAFYRNHAKMVLALIIIGALTVILVILINFTGFSEKQVDTITAEHIDLDTSEFYGTVESITGSNMIPLSPSDKIQVLNNGDEFLPDFLNEINNAKKSVTITNYIFKEGKMMNSIFDALIAKANEGIQVRVLMDGKGALDRPKDKIRSLVEAGGKVETFRPLNLRGIIRINKRTHVRAMAIDGKVAYTGGLPFSDEWLGDGTGGKKYWRDIMFKVNGMPARSIQNMFNTMWRQTTGEILTGEDYYPTLPPAIISDEDCSRSCFTSLFHAPSPDLEKDLSQLIWLSIVGSKDHIYMETPYLLPDKNIFNALIEKAKQGVDVKILVPGPYIDSKIVQLASKSYYAEALEAGIKIYEYQSAGFHSKIFTIDGHWSIVGSPNLDNRSSTLNIEGVLLIEDEIFAKNLEKEIAKDLEHTKEITKENFKERWIVETLGRISRLFSKQY
jgi:cardiolipin synthase A/B